MLQQILMDWSISNFLNNLNKSLFGWGQVIVVIIGVIMVIVGVFLIAKGLMSQGRGQTNWFLAIVLLLIGGCLAFAGGWGWLQDVGNGARNQLNELGEYWQLFK
jgi:hypothetical protein